MKHRRVKKVFCVILSACMLMGLTASAAPTAFAEEVENAVFSETDPVSETAGNEEQEIEAAKSEDSEMYAAPDTDEEGNEPEPASLIENDPEDLFFEESAALMEFEDVTDEDTVTEAEIVSEEAEEDPLIDEVEEMEDAALEETSPLADGETITVTTWDQLKSALEGNTYKTVKLGCSITSFMPEDQLPSGYLLNISNGAHTLDLDKYDLKLGNYDNPYFTSGAWITVSGSANLSITSSAKSAVKTHNYQSSKINNSAFPSVLVKDTASLTLSNARIEVESFQGCGIRAEGKASVALNGGTVKGSMYWALYAPSIKGSSVAVSLKGNSYLGDQSRTGIPAQMASDGYGGLYFRPENGNLSVESCTFEDGIQLSDQYVDVFSPKYHTIMVNGTAISVSEFSGIVKNIRAMGRICRQSRKASTFQED